MSISAFPSYLVYTIYMAELKTKKNRGSVHEFIKSVDDEQKRKDSKELLKIFRSATGERPVMWGSSIIGYGSYHYKSERSSQEGDWMLTAFSPRKAQISIYLMPGVKKYEQQLQKLGKFKMGKGSCLYIKKLEDVDTKVLEKIIKKSVADMKKIYPESK